MDELLACCGSTAWAAAMFARQPFRDSEELHAAADEVWRGLKPDDWLEAFSSHPRIGQRSQAQWAAQEQSGMKSAALETASEMARLNEKYDAKFGFIFIICATGKTAEEMLEQIRLRVLNSREAEMRIAADEQAKITHLRLNKVFVA